MVKHTSFMKALSKHKEDKGVFVLYNPVSEYGRICGIEKISIFLSERNQPVFIAWMWLEK